jgi:nucleoid-associated protein YgaU
MESIAKSYFGAGSKWPLIAKANPSVNPDTMRIGTKLKIPAAGSAALSESTVATRAASGGATKSSSGASANAGGSGSHVVAKGETLSSIARRYYGDSKYWKSLQTANPKIKADSLAVGTKLVIPAKSTIVVGERVER